MEYIVCNLIYILQYYTAQLNNPYQLGRHTHKNTQYFTLSWSRRESPPGVASWQSSDTNYSNVQAWQAGRVCGSYARVSALATHFIYSRAGATERVQKRNSSTESFEFLIDYKIILVHLIVLPSLE